MSLVYLRTSRLTKIYVELTWHGVEVAIQSEFNDLRVKRLDQVN